MLFQAVGLKSRKAGEGGEAGYGIPDAGSEDSEAVMNQVNDHAIELRVALDRCVVCAVLLQHLARGPAALLEGI